MLTALVAVVFQIPGPTLDEIYAKVGAYPGVHIEGEMVRPSVVKIEFKIAPGGRMWAKYPTSQQFITDAETVTWMPDRRQYAKEKSERISPTPAGFESLWPGATRMTQTGESKSATFAGQAAWDLPCRSENSPNVHFFVAKGSLLPLGTIATANGNTFEIIYRKVKVGALPAKDFQFVPPKDAKPYEAIDPTAKLPKTGALMPNFEAKDIDGRRTGLKPMLQGRKGFVMNLWFSACTGCIQELPALSKLGKEFASKGVAFLGVNPIDDAKTARRTLSQHRIPFSTIVGKDAKTIADSLGVVAYPVTVVVDAKGQVVDTLPFFDEPRLLKALKKVTE